MNTDQVLILIAISAYITGTLAFLIYFLSRENWAKLAGIPFAFIGCVTQFVELFYRWQTSHIWPLTNLYGSLSLFAAMSVLIFIAFSLRYDLWFMGGFVLVVAAIFLIFAYLSANLRPAGGYPVTAVFSSIDGLTVGSDVRVGGVKVGIVTGETLDSKDYRAVVDMSLEPRLPLPVDTKAVVASAGLMGGKYVKLEPGSAKETLKPGDEITNTEGAVVLEELLGKIIFLATDQSQGTTPAK